MRERAEVLRQPQRLPRLADLLWLHNCAARNTISKTELA
jgi:hypothetical protein